MESDPIPALKRLVLRELQRAIDGWDTPELCFLLRTDQPRVSNLRNGRIERFSLEQLIRFLDRVDHVVVLTTRKRPRVPHREVRGRAIGQ